MDFLQTFLRQINLSRLHISKETRFWLVTLLLWLGILLSINLLTAQNLSLADARQLSTSRQYEKADRVYDQLLAKQPDRIAILVGKGFNLSWKGDYDGAKKVFTQILQIEPDQPDAISGLGYTLAWEGSYAKSKSFFRRLLQNDPNSFEGVKGLAYVALWEKDAPEAIRRFESLTDLYSNDADLMVSLAQSYLLANRHISARTALDKALKIKSNHSTAVDLRDRLSATQALIEMNLWGGFTHINDANKAGVRAARITWQAKEDLQLWLRYDNALTFDNFALVRQQQEIAAWFTGGLYSWNEQFTTRLEAGYRQPDSNLSQLFIQGEQVMYLSGNHAVRLGGFFGPRSDGFYEWMSYVGGVFSVNDAFRLEPTYFYAQSNLSTTKDHRLLLAWNYRFDGGIEVNSGVQYGIILSESNRQSLYGAHAITQLPVGLHWLQGLIRFERGPGTNLIIGALGVRFRLER